MARTDIKLGPHYISRKTTQIKIAGKLVQVLYFYLDPDTDPDQFRRDEIIKTGTKGR